MSGMPGLFRVRRGRWTAGGEAGRFAHTVRFANCLYRKFGLRWDAGRCEWGRPTPELGTSAGATFPSPHPFWIPAPYRGTGQALRWNDDWGPE